MLSASVSDNAADGTFSALNDLPEGGCISTLAEGTPHAANGGASEIRITSDGRFAYAAVRFTGKDNGPPAADGEDPDQSGWAVFNQIAILSLDATTGAAKLERVRMQLMHYSVGIPVSRHRLMVRCRQHCQLAFALFIKFLRDLSRASSISSSET